MNIEHEKTLTKKIMRLIISKGGLYSDIAKLYIDNHEKSVLFIFECSKQCHSAIAQLYWGDDLTKKIKSYSSSLNN